MPPPVDDTGYDGALPPVVPPPTWLVPPTPPERWAAALFEEVRIGHGLNVPTLLRHGAAANAFDAETLGTALIIAAESKQPTMVPLLLKNGAPVNFATRENGDTALVIAIGNEDWLMASLLLVLGADPDLPDPLTKNTPLIVAILEADWLAADLLVHHGANVNLRHAVTGESPWMLAQALGHGPVLREILSRAPRPDTRSPTAQAQVPVFQAWPEPTPGQENPATLPGAAGIAAIDDTGWYLTTDATASDVAHGQELELDAQATDDLSDAPGLSPLHGPWQHH